MPLPRLLVAIVAAGFIGQAGAQESGAPPSVDPARIDIDFFDQEKQGEAPPLELREPSQMPPASRMDRMYFQLEEIRFEGQQSVSVETLEPLYSDWLGRKVSVADIYRLAAALTTELRRRDWLLTRVVVPPQRIEAGVVRLQVVEGFIDKVSYAGDLRDGETLLERYSRHISDSRPLQTTVLERYLLLANDLPGIDARAVLSPSETTPGASDLEWRLRRRRMGGFIAADNRGIPYTGDLQAYGGFDGGDLFGRYERIRVRFMTSNRPQRLGLLNVAYAEPAGGEGLMWNIAFDYSRVEPGDELANLELTGTSYGLRSGIAYPLVRSRMADLTVEAGVGAVNTRNEALQAGIAEDRIRKVRLAASGLWRDGYGWTGCDVAYHQGFDGLGAGTDIQPTVADAEYAFWKFAYTCRRQQLIGRSGWSVLAAAAGQLAGDTLVSSERFGIGGREFVRAYDPSEVTGDQGHAAKFEVQYHWRRAAAIRTVQPFGYYDWGRVTNKAGGEEQRTAAGAGIRFETTASIGGALEYAVPLGDPVEATGSDSARWFVELVARF